MNDLQDYALNVLQIVTYKAFQYINISEDQVELFPLAQPL